MRPITYSSLVPTLKLTSFSNRWTARPIEFDVTYSCPVSSLKVTSFSNWRTARPIQFDVTFSTPVSSLKVTSFSNWRTARPLKFDVTYSTHSFLALLLSPTYRYIGVVLNTKESFAIRHKGDNFFTN